MSGTLQDPRLTEMAQRVTSLELRLTTLESRLGVADGASVEFPARGNGDHPGLAAIETSVIGPDDFGQNGFALAGVIALTLGIAFMLSLPYASLPAAVPGVVGVVIASALFVVARAMERRRGALALYVRGAAMVLLVFAAARFQFFGRTAALAPQGLAGGATLFAAVMVAAIIAWRARSAGLVFLALVLGCAALLTMERGWCVAAGVPALAGAVAIASARGGWPRLLLAGIAAIHATYFLWSIGNPLRGGKVHYVTEPAAAPWLLLCAGGIFAAATLLRAKREHEDAVTHTASLLNCVLGYAVLLLHSAAAFPAAFAWVQTGTFLGALGAAVLFWTGTRSRVATFFYAMTGYFSLSMAIAKWTDAPAVFVWLSLQSLVVVATAIWFRSRLIVAANFLIYAVIVGAHVLLVKRETGISVGFGAVALLSAAVLGWQRARLELKTSLMQNAYLVSGFAVLPYALHHLVAARHVALAWLALAVGYYLLAAWRGSREHRWMGHGTLVLTALFLVFAAGGRVEPLYRIASFLALGTVLLAVSITMRGEGRPAR